jgi:hypothetical protein
LCCDLRGSKQTAEAERDGDEGSAATNSYAPQQERPANRTENFVPQAALDQVRLERPDK